MKFRFTFSLVFVLASFLLAASPAIAGDEVCVVNLTDVDVQAGGPGKGRKTINDNGDNAMCISVNLENAGPNEGVGVWMEAPSGASLEVDISDPVVGGLDFTKNGTDNDFNGGDLGGNLSVSGAQKGNDGVYRIYIRKKS